MRSKPEQVPVIHAQYSEQLEIVINAYSGTLASFREDPGTLTSDDRLIIVLCSSKALEWLETEGRLPARRIDTRLSPTSKFTVGSTPAWDRPTLPADYRVTSDTGSGVSIEYIGSGKLSNAPHISWFKEYVTSMAHLNNWQFL